MVVCKDVAMAIKCILGLSYVMQLLYINILYLLSAVFICGLYLTLIHPIYEKNYNNFGRIG